jgi:hypothetical protein
VGTCRMARWWGPDSPECQDAFLTDWSREVLWLNPPFTKYAQVVDKVIKDRTHAVVILPEWPRQKWYHQAKALEVRGIRFPERTHLFETGEKGPKGTKWPVEALYVCGDKEKCPLHGAGGHCQQTKTETGSADVMAARGTNQGVDPGQPTPDDGAVLTEKPSKGRASGRHTQGDGNGAKRGGPEVERQTSDSSACGETSDQPAETVKVGTGVMEVTERAMPVRVDGMKDDNLRITVKVAVGDNFERELVALIDTGAQVDLIRRDLVPEELTRPATARIRLVMANAQPLKGGKREVEADLVFAGHDEDTRKPVEVKAPTVLYLADINDDIILSYSWLGSRQFAVYPRQHGLKGRQGNTRVWVPGTPSERVYGVSAHPMKPTTTEEEGDNTRKKALLLLPAKAGVREALERQGYEVETTSDDRKCRPTVQVSVHEWGYAGTYPVGHYGVMVAAPPVKRDKPVDLGSDARCDRLVNTFLRLVRYFQPPVWWIALPRASSEKLLVQIPGISAVDCDACQFGGVGNKGPIRFLGGEHLRRLPQKICDGATCRWLTVETSGTQGPRHKNAQSGHATGVKRHAAGSLPIDMVEYALGVVGEDKTAGTERVAETHTVQKMEPPRRSKNFQTRWRPSGKQPYSGFRRRYDFWAWTPSLGSHSTTPMGSRSPKEPRE